MANENVIGIKFGVSGGGLIDGDSGKRIKNQLTSITKKINLDDSVTRIKFQIDETTLNAQITKIKDKIEKALSNINVKISSTGGTSSNAAKQSNGKSSKASSSNSNDAQRQAQAYREASAAISQYYKLFEKVTRAQTRTTSISGDSTTGWSANGNAKYTELVDQLNKAQIAYESVQQTIANGNFTVEQRAELLRQAGVAEANLSLKTEEFANRGAEAWGNLSAKTNDYIERVRVSASRSDEARAKLEELQRIANSGDYHNYDTLNSKLRETQQYINENSLATETWYQKLQKTFGGKIRGLITAFISMKVVQFFKDIYESVVELDGAITDLQIATGKTRKETTELIREYSKLAKQLGATTMEVAESADTWLRQGYSIEQANTLIKNSMMLSKLGQIESAEAAKNLTSAMKGYKVSVEDSVSIVDKFTAVDMQAATSAGEIATAMAETATSADIAGVSMDKLIGYIATVKEVTQDGAESVGM